MGKMMAETVDPRETATTITLLMEVETVIQDMTAMMIEIVDTDPMNTTTATEEDEVLIEEVTIEEDVVVGAAEVLEAVTVVVTGEGTNLRQLPIQQ